MGLDVPPFVEKVNLHEAIELAPAEAFLNNPKLLSGGEATSVRFEHGGMQMSLEDYLSDGLHLKNPSYEIMYKLVTNIINDKWPEILPENMPMLVPWWGDVVAQKTLDLRDEL